MRRMLRVNLTIPVYNEEAALPVSIPRLNQFLNCFSGFDCKIVIVDSRVKIIKTA